MRKFLLFLAFCMCITTLNAQTVLFEDDFESYTITTPNTGDGTQIPPGYTSYDVNGDSYNWGLSNPTHWTQPMGDIYTGNFMASVSYHTGPNVPVDADNILVLPMISIPADATDVNLSYYAGSGTDTGFFSETYDVIVTTTNSQAAILAATPVFTETLPFQGGETKTVNLDDFIGQDIYISFYHRDTFDQWVLGIDDVMVTTGGGGGGADYCDIVDLDCAIEKINSVTFAGIENLNTGCGTAATNDFTDMVAEVSVGESYDMIVDLDADPAFPDDNAFFFIDWNQNGTLDDAGEVYEIIMHTGTSGEYTVSVTVPDDAMTGETRLRVGIAYNSGDDYVPQPCPGEDGTLFGEYEDYTVNVSGGGGPSEGNCDLTGELADPALGGPVWDRPLADGSDLSAVGMGVSYHVYGPFTVDTAGAYDFTSTQTGWDGLIFVYQNNFDPNDQLTNYLAGNDDGAGGVGTSELTANLVTGTEYFLITTAFAPEDFGPFTNTIDGPGAVTCDGGGGPGGDDCDVTYDGTLQDGLGDLSGLQVANDFTVDADVTMTVDQVTLNIFGNITDGSVYIYEDAAGMPGTVIDSYTSLTPTSQTLVGSAFGFNVYEVVFDLPTSSVLEGGAAGSIYWVGVTTTVGSEAMPNYWEMADSNTNAIAMVSTDGGASWVANSFGQDGAFSVSGTCEGDGGPGGDDCEVMYDGSFQDGLGDLQGLQVANDFTVAANTTMDVEQVRVNLFSNVTTASVYIYEDAAGMPGTLIGSHEGITPTSQDLVGSAFGFNIYEVVLDLPSAVTAEGGASESIFWVGITTTAGSEGTPNYWEMADSNTNAIAMVSTDGGASWVANSFGQDGAFAVAGVCGELGISEMDSYDFAYYPNPVKDELNITSQKVIESVSIYNLAGQQVGAQNMNLSQGKVSIRTLAPGVYVFRVVLQGGQVETFKIIKK